MSAATLTESSLSNDHESPQWRDRAAKFAREHPYMVGLLAGGAVLGAVIGAAFPVGDLTVVRRVLGGAVAGFYFGLFPLGYRLLD